MMPNLAALRTLRAAVIVGCACATFSVAAQGLKTYTDCVQEYAARFAPTPASASEIADAALHACANVRAVREFLGRHESPKPTLQAARQLLEEEARRMAIWMVLHVRYPQR
jgi:hypothetical protein